MHEIDVKMDLPQNVTVYMFRISMSMCHVDPTLIHIDMASKSQGHGGQGEDHP